MTTSQISFKFKNEKNYDSIKFIGQSISIRDLKTKIKQRLQSTKSNSAGPGKEKDKDEIIIRDEQTQEEFKDDNRTIQSDKKVIIERITMNPMSFRQDQNIIKPNFIHSNPQPPVVDPRGFTNGAQLSFREIEKYLADAKYFMIKSSNFNNIKKSIDHSEWATTKTNEDKLNSAYTTSKNVILLFSVNKSSHFQGYAKMESAISSKIASYWNTESIIRLGGCFKVKWLRTCNVNFSRIGHLKNRLNNNEPIKKSRDTQEIPGEVGYEIIKLFENPDREMIPYALLESQDANRGLNSNNNDSESSEESESKSNSAENPNKFGDFNASPNKEIIEEAKEQKIEKKVDLFAGLGSGFGFDDDDDEPPVKPQEEKIIEQKPLEIPKPPQQNEILLERINDTPLEINSDSRDGEASKGEESMKSEPEKIVSQTTPPPIPENSLNKPPENPPKIAENRPPPPVVNMNANYSGYGFNPGYPGMPYGHPYNRPMMPPGGPMGMNNMNPYYGYNYNQPMWPGAYPQKPGAYMPNAQTENQSDYDSDDEDRDRKKNKKKSKKKKKRKSDSRSRSRSHSKSRRN